MFVCMMEYRIGDQDREDYLEWLRQLGETHPQAVLYEGTDQHGLFVEVWPASTAEEAQRIQDAARAGAAPWRELTVWTGGKINAWSFRRLT